MGRRRPTQAFPPRSSAPGNGPDDLDVERAVRALPRRQRLAVELHYFVGLTTAQAAAVMGCAEGTVKSCLFDARAGLRRKLEQP
jgi:RNA polymerase sigma-70 factor (ECF subfamily)